MKKEIIYGIVLAFVFAGTNSVDASFKRESSTEFNSTASATFGKNVGKDSAEEEKQMNLISQKIDFISKLVQAMNKTYEVMSSENFKKFEIAEKELKKLSDAFQKAKDFKRKPFENMFAASNKNKLDPEITKKALLDILTAIGDAVKNAQKATDTLEDEKIRDSSISKFKKKRDDAKKVFEATQKDYDDSLGTLKQAVQQFSEKGKEYLAHVDTSQTDTEKKSATLADDDYNAINKMRDIFVLAHDLKEIVGKFRNRVTSDAKTGEEVAQ